MAKVMGRARYPLFDVFRLLLAAEVARMHFYQHTIGPYLIVPAVPAFLGISGFLVLQSFDLTPKWRVFAFKRALRIVPAFLAMLALVVVLHGAERAGFVFLHWLTLGFGPQSVNNAVWSLGWEELFYGLLALLFGLGVYRRPRVVLALAGVSALVAFAFSTADPTVRANDILPLAMAFFLGNLGYLHRDRLPAFRHAGLPLVALGTAAHVVTRFAPLSTLLTISGLLLLAAGYKPRLPRFPDLSYGVYIYHVPILVWCTWNDRLWAFLPLLALVCVASWFFVEAPALRLKQKKTETSGDSLPDVATQNV